MKPSLNTGGLIWITGLSGAGKTTIAKKIINFLNNQAILIDGDEMRKVLDLSSSSYDIDSRKKIAFIYVKMCTMLANQGFLVICSTISMYDDVRKYARENNKYYCEIFLNISEKERRKRDPKKLYEYHNNQIIHNMAGLDYTIELPKSPDIVIEDGLNINDSVDYILKYLEMV